MPANVNSISSTTITDDFRIGTLSPPKLNFAKGVIVASGIDGVKMQAFATGGRCLRKITTLLNGRETRVWYPRRHSRVIDNIRHPALICDYTGKEVVE